MKIKEILNKKNNSYYLIIFLISLFLSYPLFRKGFFFGHDGANHVYRILTTADELSMGNYLPLISSKLCNGFGYSWNIFYGPLTVYVPILLKFITPSYIAALKVMIFLSIFVSGITMYNFVLEVSGSKKTAILASVFYITASYRLTDIYTRLAIRRSGKFCIYSVGIPWIV